MVPFKGNSLNRNFYSKQDDKFLTENVGTMPLDDIANKLGRTKGGLRQRMSKLNLSTKAKPKKTSEAGVAIEAESKPKRHNIKIHVGTIEETIAVINFLSAKKIQFTIN